MPKPKAPTNPPPSPTGECWCGCGGDTKPGRHFLPGHDRRAESKVIKVEYGGSVQFLVAHGYGPGGKKQPRITFPHIQPKDESEYEVIEVD